MGIVKTESFSVDMAGVTSVKIQTSALALIPKIVSILVLLTGLYMIAYFAGVGMGGFGKDASWWSATLQGIVLFFMICLGIALVVSSISIVVSDELSDGSRGVVVTVFGIGAVLMLSGAATSYYFASGSGGASFNLAQQEGAKYSILVAAGLILALLSFGFVGRKDVKIVRSTGTETIRNVDKADALLIRDSVAA